MSHHDDSGTVTKVRKPAGYGYATQSNNLEMPDGWSANGLASGYRRLTKTVHISADWHLRLKILAADARMPIGKMIEGWIDVEFQRWSTPPTLIDQYETPQFDGANTWDGVVPCNRWHSRLYRWLRRMVKRS